MDVVVHRRQALLAAQRHHEEAKRPGEASVCRGDADDDKLLDVVGTSDTPLHPLHPAHHLTPHHHPGDCSVNILVQYSLKLFSL